MATRHIHCIFVAVVTKEACYIPRQALAHGVDARCV